MSSTGRGAARQPADFYPSPAYTVRRFLESEAGQALPGGLWLEAGAGHGHIIDAVNACRDDVTWAAVELRERDCRAHLEKLVAPERLLFGDLIAAETQEWIREQAPVVIFGNIPYNLTNRLLPLLRQHRCYLVQLLSMGIWGSSDRADFLRNDAPDTRVLPERVKFLEGSGTDSVYSAWMVWHPEQRAEGVNSMLASTPTPERAPAVLKSTYRPKVKVLSLFPAAGGAR